VREVSADKAYSSVDNHEVLESLGVEAYIPFKENAVVNLKSPIWSRHLCYFLLNREKFLPHYHRRSNVETAFAMIKAKSAGRCCRVARSRRSTKCWASWSPLCCQVKAIFTADLAPVFWEDAAPVTAARALALVRP